MLGDFDGILVGFFGPGKLGVLGKYELDRETLPATSPTCHTIPQENKA